MKQEMFTRKGQQNNPQRMHWATLAVIASLMGCGLSGCAWSVGGRDGQTYVQPTRGQELVDLKKALDSGAITEEEFQAQKQRVMDQ